MPTDTYTAMFFVFPPGALAVIYEQMKGVAAIKTHKFFDDHIHELDWSDLLVIQFSPQAQNPFAPRDFPSSGG